MYSWTPVQDLDMGKLKSASLLLGTLFTCSDTRGTCPEDLADPASSTVPNLRSESLTRGKGSQFCFVESALHQRKPDTQIQSSDFKTRRPSTRFKPQALKSYSPS